MFLKFLPLSYLLFVSAALAFPSSRLEDRIARRREYRHSGPINRIEAHSSLDVEYSDNWAGAVWDETAGTFTTVTGTFIVPIPSGSDGAASAWVGIDGDTCQNVILQTGVDFTISGGEVSYDAWYEWYPHQSYDFSGVTISAGDQIKATVTAYSTTSGIAIIENLTTGQTVNKQLSSKYELCQENAEWIVEDFEGDNGTLVPFANFGSVKFFNASASDSDGIVYTPSGATLNGIKQKHEIKTSVTVDEDTVTIDYI